jgi:hypothetical protein
MGRRYKHGQQVRTTGFDRETMLRCHTECFEFQDLSERYANPSNLDEAFKGSFPFSFS